MLRKQLKSKPSQTKRKRCFEFYLALLAPQKLSQCILCFETKSLNMNKKER